MKTLIYLLEKEFRQIFRNPSIVRTILAIPVIQLLLLPQAAEYEIKNINISVVDHDHSTYSRKLLQAVGSSGYFRLTRYDNSYPRAYEEFERGEADLMLEIPPNFERNLICENEASLFLAANAINGTNASVGSAYLGRIVSSVNADIRMEWLPQLKPEPLIEVVSSNWFNPTLSYKLFIVPGILVILVTMTGSYMTALNIVKEKEAGTIEQINVTPIQKHYFLLGKLIPFWIIGMLVFSIGLFLVGRLVYGIVPAGSLGILYGFLALYLVAMLGIGLLISTYSNTQQQAMSLAFFCMMVFILMSGVFTSIDSMPEWAKVIARLNPVTYFIEVIRMVVLKGSGWNQVQSHFLIMSGFALFFNTWAILNYRKTS
jgi:ABC-2 type transport system permease protein